MVATCAADVQRTTTSALNNNNVCWLNVGYHFHRSRGIFAGLPR